MRKFRRDKMRGFQQKKARGFMLIELILAVIVIAILTGLYFREGSGSEQAASQFKVSMDRSKAAACLASRAGLRTQIMSYSMQNSGQPITTEALQKSGINLNVCPSGGTITVSPDGTLHCSIHDQPAGQGQ